MTSPAHLGRWWGCAGWHRGVADKFVAHGGGRRGKGEATFQPPAPPPGLPGAELGLVHQFKAKGWVPGFRVGRPRQRRHLSIKCMRAQAFKLSALPKLRVDLLAVCLIGFALR